jgi:hypothetical protein
MILPDNKCRDGRCADNTLQGLLAVAENFPRPDTFAAFRILLVFLPAIFIFHLRLPERIKYSLKRFYEILFAAPKDRAPGEKIFLHELLLWFNYREEVSPVSRN